ncbi:UDP-glycosyltransferase 75C1-like [Salvia hispanica]|uniref:UDP-glycosyltransferase 75C1-like n=1 Tax=Salvia hispanica TaxID=49212 RepID=UPI0020092215|nr:UDP-glycosyltransferase 75C1-like [Salvia hispanica]
MADKHILLVTYPAQGHINPSLQLAKRLAKRGVNVTILTSRYATAAISPSFHPLIDVVSFSTAFEWSTQDASRYMKELSHHGTKAIEAAVAARPYTRIVYNLLVPWAARAARRLGVPFTLLWIQPAALFGVYFHYYNNKFDPSDEVIELPGLPRLRRGELPSFFQDTSPSTFDFAIALFSENFEILDGEDEKPTVVVNTFDALEAEALRDLDKYRLLAIGPLIPSAFLDGSDPSDVAFGGDLIQKSENYMQYLDSLERESVIYVAFGSYLELTWRQTEAIAEALVRIRRPFLWVVRGSDEREKLRCKEELLKRGRVVNWCNQVEGEIVEADEIVRCLEMVMDGGDESRKMRENAKKWRDLAREAVDDGGTSQVNLGIFLNQIVGGR